MYVYGSECTLTLIRDNKPTAIPYSLETLREEREEVALDPLVGYMMPLVHVPCGYGEPKVLGCAVTRVCGTSFKPLARLLVDGSNNPFQLRLNRVVEKRIYTGLLLGGWEVRADREEAVYLRLDMEGREASDWLADTDDLPWVQNETFFFYDGDLAFDGVKTDNVYRFSLTRLYGDAINTILQLHYPLKNGDLLNDCRRIAAVTLTLEWRLRFTLGALVLLTYHANTDNAEEILVVRRGTGLTET